MENKQLQELKYLRDYLDNALLPCDPLSHALNQQNLLHAIAEHLIRPLQENEMAGRSKLRPLDEIVTLKIPTMAENDCDENEDFVE